MPVANELTERAKDFDPLMIDSLVDTFEQDREKFGDPKAVIDYLEFSSKQLAIMLGISLKEARLNEADILRKEFTDHKVIREAMARAKDKEEMRNRILDWIEDASTDDDNFKQEHWTPLNN
jgi:hypothetical protein